MAISLVVDNSEKRSDYVKLLSTPKIKHCLESLQEVRLPLDTAKNYANHAQSIQTTESITDLLAIIHTLEAHLVKLEEWNSHL